MSRSSSAIAKYHEHQLADVSLLLEMLNHIEYGSISIITPEGQNLHFAGSKKGEDVFIDIHNWKVCELLLLKGDIGLGESYIEGHWDSRDINKLIKFGVDNHNTLARVIKGSLLKFITYRIKHLFNKNSKKGSEKNIHAHYDLGNSFYRLWLDQSMTYSSGLFLNTTTELERAQENKYENILRQLNVKEGEHILEIGCGWGGFIEYAAKKGIKVTGITISKEQLEFAKKRVSEYQGLAEVKYLDYRDIQGQYDHIVSIEMFEALGEAYWKKYFSIIEKTLRPGGKAVIQTITMNDKDFPSYRRGSDFIQHYIFPGGMLPSPSIFKKKAHKAGLDCISELEFGQDYALTLSKWEESFNKVNSQVKELGFNEKFIRMWRFYLKYCQGGFEASKTSVYQFLLSK